MYNSLTLYKTARHLVPNISIYFWCLFRIYVKLLSLIYFLNYVRLMLVVPKIRGANLRDNCLVRPSRKVCFIDNRSTSSFRSSQNWRGHSTKLLKKTIVIVDIREAMNFNRIVYAHRHSSSETCKLLKYFTAYPNSIFNQNCYPKQHISGKSPTFTR